MAAYRFSGPYGSPVKVELKKKTMAVTEFIDMKKRVTTFRYQDIDTYSVTVNEDGTYKAFFFSSKKKIKIKNEDSESLDEMFTLVTRIPGNVSVSGVKGHSVIDIEVSEDMLEKDFVYVIRRHTPLRTQMDRVDEEAQRIRKKYENAGGTGTVTVTGLNLRKSSALFFIDGVYVFTASGSTGEIDDVFGLKVLSDSEVSFSLPYGRFLLGCVLTTQSDFDYSHDLSKYAKQLEVAVSKKHQKAVLKAKKQLFKTKLVELE